MMMTKVRDIVACYLAAHTNDIKGDNQVLIKTPYGAISKRSMHASFFKAQ